jgi:crossover junction endodeoxyribonuclease RusA
MIILDYPHKALWPNGRSHWAEKARQFKSAKLAAAWATRAANIRLGDSPIPLHIEVRPKRYGPAPDRDNAISAAKAYIDGIASALAIDDRHFAAPTVSISDKRTGQFIITIGETHDRS